jgi:hypothetical protein
MQIRFITFLITLIVWVGDCYSMIGPTLRLAAETVGSRLSRVVGATQLETTRRRRRRQASPRDQPGRSP